MALPNEHRVHITLKGQDNASYTGTLVLRNLSLPVPPGVVDDGMVTDPSINDPLGASYYVIAVVLVYGMSIILLIASHIKRKPAKLIQDRQIHKYLQEYQVVQERSSRDSYRTLKKTIIARLTRERKKTYTNLSRAIIPVVAVGMPRWGSSSEMASDTREGDKSDYGNDELGGISNWELMRAVAGPDTHRPRTNSLCGQECERPPTRPRALSTAAVPYHFRRGSLGEELATEAENQTMGERSVRLVLPEIPQLQVEGSDEPPGLTRSTGSGLHEWESTAPRAHHHHHSDHRSCPSSRRLSPAGMPSGRGHQGTAGMLPLGRGHHEIWTLSEQEEPADEPSESQGLMATLAVAGHTPGASRTPSPQGSRRSRSPSPRAYSRSPSPSPRASRHTDDLYSHRTDYESNRATETEHLIQITCL